ncbi:MAG TPA: LysE family translocator [Vicinamibacteria bacterium]
MIDTTTLGLFVAAAALLLITPGPAVLYIVARSVEQGRAAGIVSVLGIQAGTLVHVAAAAFGVSAVLVSSALAFSVLKYAGAAYLVYLGIRTLTRSEADGEPGVLPRERSLGRVFVQGVVVNVLNPKTAIFFLAFLPQFVDPARGAVAGQVLLLGLVFVSLGAFTDGTWALLAGSAAGFLRNHAGFRRGQRYVAGSVCLGLGIATAVSGRGGK